MDIRKIDDRISVAPQIQADDIAELVKAGFRSIISNRPDGEVSDQPTLNEIADAAEAAGIEFRALPLIPGQITPELIEDFGRALDELPKPVLAYCRSGTRSATLWALSQAGRQPAADILEAANRAGYDLSKISDLLKTSD